MNAYTKTALQTRGLDKDFDTMYCDVCGSVAVDVHHISNSFRGKRKHKADGSDLALLCREHHNRIHANNTDENREELLNLVQFNLKGQT